MVGVLRSFLYESPHLIMHIIILYKNNGRADRFRLGRSLHSNRSTIVHTGNKTGNRCEMLLKLSCHSEICQWKSHRFVEVLSKPTNQLTKQFQILWLLLINKELVYFVANMNMYLTSLEKLCLQMCACASMVFIVIIHLTQHNQDVFLYLNTIIIVTMLPDCQLVREPLW